MAHHSPAHVRTIAHPYSPTTISPPYQPSVQQLLNQLPVSLGHLQCRYRSKVCTNIRASKRDGSLHRYCEQHRQRANTNQKIWAQRRMQAIEDRDQPVLKLVAAVPDAEGSEHRFASSWQPQKGEPIPEFSATDSDCELLWQALGLDHDADDDDDGLGEGLM